MLKSLFVQKSLRALVEKSHVKLFLKKVDMLFLLNLNKRIIFADKF